ncbi:exodeoxyribonuclease VII small subunit [Bifidobacterium castoris]|uniref:Exodeoxyribonuclease 7 small subunit n=1 Tax=Bifidobacterium castoris TaxID=2306972 RepID=A0A430F5Y8_9BIFI|nr:exodeoxyribonuclease VII small subunit [Bifidobacterium castoris]MDE5640335.1 exodeoxyribonuclease VII small subunit [Bifidobacterium castoris]RSX47147.1 exonuclease VII small subunit [Bifidobacterium castoris]
MTEETIEVTATETTETTEDTAAEQPQIASSLTAQERDVIANMPYEEARDKLMQAVRALENGGLSLDESMRQWEIGEALAQRAQSLLNTVRAKLDAAQAQQAQTAATAGTQSNLQ